MKTLKIGTRIVVTNILGGHGTIVTKPMKLLGDIFYGIKFDDYTYNSVFDPMYISVYNIEKESDYEL